MSAAIFNKTEMMVIADFDGTFTKKEVMGKKTSSLMTVLVNEKYLGEAGTRECQALFEHYYPIEIDPHIPQPEKVVLMHEWWIKTFAVLKKSGLTKQMLLEVCDSPLLEWREGLLDFLRLLEQQNIPLIVFSAGGFGQLAIEYLLAKENLFGPNVQVMSNRLIFDEQGRFIEMVEPIITIANKTGEVLVRNGLLAARPERRQCLLIGDTLEDDQMVQGLEFELVHKVAFAGHNDSHFEERFDLVLEKNAGYEQISALLNS